MPTPSRPNKPLFDAIRDLANETPEGARHIAAGIAVAAAHMFFDGRTGPIDAWVKTRTESARAEAHALALSFQVGERNARHLAAEAVASATHEPNSGYYAGTPVGALWCANEYFHGALCMSGGRDYAARYEARLLQALHGRHNPARIARSLLDVR